MHPHVFIHFFCKHKFSIYYMLHTFPATGGVAVNKTCKVPILRKVTFWWEINTTFTHACINE